MPNDLKQDGLNQGGLNQGGLNQGGLNQGSLNRDDVKPKKEKRRIQSLDVFRGISIAGMILVNILAWYPDTPSLLRHAPWIGLTLADLVFPFFLFIVGVSMSYSFAYRSLQSPWKLWGHFIIRVVLLYLIGIALAAAFFIYGIPDFATIRIPGVLQLIALSSLFAAPLARSRIRWVFLLAGILLAVHTFILMGVSVPGVPAGSLDIDNNIAGWIDVGVFGSNHLANPNFDPEGLLAVVSSTALVLLGLACGRTLRLRGGDWAVVKIIIAGGTISIIIGLITSFYLPFIKQMWTSSFILVTAGLGAVILALLYGYMDLMGRGVVLRLAIPFGRNALIIYILSVVFGVLIFQPAYVLSGGQVLDLDGTIIPFFSGFIGPVGGTLIFGFVVIAFWWCIAYLLNWRKIYIKL